MVTTVANSGRTHQQLRLLQLVIALSSFSYAILEAALPIYLKEINARGTETGLVISAGYLMSAISRPIIGRGLDRYGRRRFLLLAIAMTGLGMLVYAFSTRVELLLAAGILRGFGLGTKGYIELRKYVDIGGRPGANHLFIVDGQGVRYENCDAVELPYGRQLIADVIDRSETAMPQRHAFLAAELALQAQASATLITQTK